MDDKRGSPWGLTDVKWIPFILIHNHLEVDMKFPSVGCIENQRISSKPIYTFNLSAASYKNNNKKNTRRKADNR